MQPHLVKMRIATLTVLLRDDAPPNIGLVDVGMGSRLSLNMAVRVTLADLARISARIEAGHRHDARGELLEADLERLYHLATVNTGAQ